GRQRRADQRAEAEDEGGFRGEGIDAGRALAVHQVGGQADAAQETAQHVLGQRHHFRGGAREVDAEVTAVVAEHGSFFPAHADQTPGRPSVRRSSVRGSPRTTQRRKASGSTSLTSQRLPSTRDGCTRTSSLPSCRNRLKRRESRWTISSSRTSI